MPAYKDQEKGTWYVSFYFQDWTGARKKKMKRGFATKKDALNWERQFLMQQTADLDMEFEKFVELYVTDKKERLRENTWSSKEHIIRTKILPYFKDKRLSEIAARDVIAWQNQMLNYRNDKGKGYSPTYLKSLHSQLSSILNHAVRYYGLKNNAAAIAGNMGADQKKEMLFWTKEEYLKFAEVIMDKPRSYYAFEVLYWCGIREGELVRFVDDGNWKTRKTGRELNFGQDKHIVETDKGKTIITVFHLNDRWKEWAKTIGEFIQLSDSDYTIDYKGKAYVVHFEQGQAGTIITFPNCGTAKDDIKFISLFRSVIIKSEIVKIS